MGSGGTTEVGPALAAQHAELAGLLHRLGPDEWDHPSRCAGWSVADVVLHLSQTDEMAVGSLQGRFGDVVAGLAEGIEPTTDVDEGADRMVAKERGAPPAELLARWQASADELRRLLAEADPHARVQWVAGELAVRTLATTRLSEAWIHTIDIADPLGIALVPDDRLRLIARLAWRTLPYAFARAGRGLVGPVAFELTGPEGQEWSLLPDEPAVTTIRGSAEELCGVAGRRFLPEDTGLKGEGPDAAAVLELVRTYA